jgi:hypothetical protein
VNLDAGWLRRPHAHRHAAGRLASGRGVVMSDGVIIVKTGSTDLDFDTTSALKGEP